ncbi:MAG: hypothetical protein GF317_22725, partial [Candidatus Lokiarchaeota archaeon]|nr:hypothetical protein [Candidatus Lokiarchaeota archaeon]
MTHDRRLIKNMLTFLKFISNDLRINIIEFLDGKTRSYDQIKNDLNVDEEKLKGQIEILRKADFIIQEENDNQIFYKIKDKRIIKILELLY